MDPSEDSEASVPERDLSKAGDNSHKRKQTLSPIDFEAVKKETTTTSMEPGESEKSAEVKRYNTCHSGHSKKIASKRIYCDDCDVRICPECDREFTRNNIYLHFKGSKLGIDCDVCGLICGSECAYKAHVRLHSDSTPPYVCPECGVIYTKARFLVQHMMRKCFYLNRTPVFVCKLCKKKLRSREDLALHLSDHISLLFKCRFCSFMSNADKGKAMHHVFTSHPRISKLASQYISRDYVCGMCSGVITKNVEGHMSIHASRTKASDFVLTCPCSSDTFTRRQLWHHVRTCSKVYNVRHWGPGINKVLLQYAQLKEKDTYQCVSCDFKVVSAKPVSLCITCKRIPHLAPTSKEVVVSPEDEENSVEFSALYYPYITIDHRLYFKTHEAVVGGSVNVNGNGTTTTKKSATISTQTPAPLTEINPKSELRNCNSSLFSCPFCTNRTCKVGQLSEFLAHMKVFHPLAAIPIKMSVNSADDTEAKPEVRQSLIRQGHMIQLTDLIKIKNSSDVKGVSTAEVKKETNVKGVDSSAFQYRNALKDREISSNVLRNPAYQPPALTPRKTLWAGRNLSSNKKPRSTIDDFDKSTARFDSVPKVYAAKKANPVDILSSKVDDIFESSLEAVLDSDISSLVNPKPISLDDDVIECSPPKDTNTQETCEKEDTKTKETCEKRDTKTHETGEKKDTKVQETCDKMDTQTKETCEKKYTKAQETSKKKEETLPTSTPTADSVLESYRKCDGKSEEKDKKPAKKLTLLGSYSKPNTTLDSYRKSNKNEEKTYVKNERKIVSSLSDSTQDDSVIEAYRKVPQVPHVSVKPPPPDDDVPIVIESSPSRLIQVKSNVDSIQFKSNAKVIQVKSNVEETKASRKEHEVWDEFYNNLSKAEKLKRKSKIGCPVITTAYSSKRVVKKPKRFEDFSDTDDEDSPKKESPERKKKKTVDEVYIFSKKSEDTENGESPKSRIQGSQTLQKPPKKITSPLHDEPRSPVKDMELNFLEKTFSSDGSPNDCPDKRKRKLASRLLYYKKINEDIEDTSQSGHECVVCGRNFSDKREFRNHIITHRVGSNKFQCMECGECFVVSQPLQKHLLAFHKIREYAKYLRENDCTVLEQEEIKEKVVDEGNDIRCKVCNQTFTTTVDLNKHFRMHGMAFLKENKKDLKQ